ncbi:hypothetical protein DICPUDRAFT_83479 [Dictyostelium purpureum]|uniref:Uncharacterized protein n=1 Tax=Dictyostelium purpureum TaxID=5786 RepID=F0ZZN7_DICPU|nr:uncharacterized protein DICPUDRAFT_83479 [Dictyostelium purpureum]EGC30590.1 hypothetical protein DICPUDRAFT_83479 [Dictyostelium purpureum]|eukprot:XP_003292878.1 hypothetical protein DICPUDRAFT_83479 [Dictyostelium purpureum]
MIRNYNYIIFIFLIILSFLTIYINGELIYFNSSKTCTEKSPCNFSNKENWIGEVLPSQGDDIVIDFSQPQPTESTIANNNINNNSDTSLNYYYLIGEKMNITIGSFSLLGSNQNYPQLFLNNTYIVSVGNTFQISSASINFYYNNTLTIDKGSLKVLEGSNFTVDRSSKINIINNSEITCDKTINKFQFLNNSSLSIDNSSVGNFYSKIVFSSTSSFIGNSSETSSFYGVFSLSSSTLVLNNAKFYYNSFIKNLNIIGQVQLDTDSNTILSILQNLYFKDTSLITIDSNTNLVIGGSVNGDNGISNTSSIVLNGGTLKITSPNFKIDNMEFSETNTGTISYQTSSLRKYEDTTNSNTYSSSSSSSSSFPSSSSSSSNKPSPSNSYFINTIAPMILVSSNSDLIIYNSHFKTLSESKSVVESDSPITFEFFGSVYLDSVSISSSSVVISPNSDVVFFKGGCLNSLNVYGNLTVYSPGISVHPNPVNILDPNAYLIINSTSVLASVNIVSGTLFSVGSSTINSLNISGPSSFLELHYSSIYIYKSFISDAKSSIYITSKISYFNTPAISVSSIPQVFSNLIVNFQILPNSKPKSCDFSIVTYNINNKNITEKEEEPAIINDDSNSNSNSAINFASIKIFDLANNNNNVNTNTTYSYSLLTTDNSLSIIFVFPYSKQAFPEWAIILIVIGSVICTITISIIIYTIKQRKRLQNEYSGYTRL